MMKHVNKEDNKTHYNNTNQRKRRKKPPIEYKTELTANKR